tara:strand:+ start:637 stop:1557 length:921 start_codon:yes stop_codon:yes gene_type:complete
VQEITLSEPWKKLVWVATTVCNYNCTYCAPALHDNKNRWPADYKPVLQMIDQFRGDSPLIVDITGGEPTLWPEFELFCKDLVARSVNKTSVQFTTNGSRTLRYWQQLTAPFDEICFSFHPEYANEDHFFAIAESLHLRYNIKIFLMMPPSDFERMTSFYSRLEASNLQIDVATKLIKYHNGAGLMPGYQQKHLAFAIKRIKRAKYNGVGRIDNVDVYLDGVRISPQDLINTKHDQFKDWHCKMGIDRLAIEPNGDIYGATCYITPSYGNVHDIASVRLPTKATVCTREYCSCGADVAIPKRKAPYV